MSTLKILFGFALALSLSACMGTNLQVQTASVPEMGRWLNGDTPVLMIAFSDSLADSAKIGHQAGAMSRSAIKPIDMYRYRVSTTNTNGRDKINVFLMGYKNGRFIGYACNYYYIQGVHAYWGSGGNQPDIWFIQGFSSNPQCERMNGYE